MHSSTPGIRSLQCHHPALPQPSSGTRPCGFSIHSIERPSSMCAKTGPTYRRCSSATPFMAHGPYYGITFAFSVSWSPRSGECAGPVYTPGNVQFGDFAEMAESALIRLADRYDPSRSGFPNYARHRLNGIIKDWRNSWVPTQPFDAAKDDPLWHLYSNDEHPTVLCERIANVVGSYYPGGQKSVRPVRSDDWLAEGLVDLDGERGRLDVIAAAANLTERQKIILAHLRRREDGYTYLGSKLGISYDHLKVEISRLKKKLRAVVTK